jgi:chaperonin GroEL
MTLSRTGCEAALMNALDSRRILSGASARAIVVKSLAECARAIGASLGPLGCGLIYDGGSGGPRHANNGLAIARQIAREDGAWSVAPRILRDALWDARRELGDGSARIACIAVAVHAVAAARVAQGVSPGLLAASIRDLSLCLPGMLEAQRRAAPEPLAVACAACDDYEVAAAIAQVSADLPEDGAVSVSEGWQAGVRIEKFAGFCLEVKPDTVGASVEEQHARLEMDAVHVLVVNEVIDDFGPLARVLEQFVSRAKSLVVVARGIEGAARATLVANRAGLGMHVVGVVPAATGLHAMHVLEDLCAMTGATLVSEETGVSLANVRPAMLGRAARLVVHGGRAVFVEPVGARDVIDNRRAFVLREADAQRYVSLDRERLLRRAARLAGGWGEIRVAGRTAWHTAERVDGARAALAAVRASAQGVVTGGGVALAAIADTLAHELSSEPLAARAAARDALVHGCRSVAVQLASNAGLDAAALQVPGEVVDPLSTTIAILRHALSAAATLLTIEVLIC